MTALAGWRVLVPRPAGRSSELITLLAGQGAVAQAVPMIEILPPVNSAELDSAVLALAAGDFDWVAFTSVNAVAAVIGRARSLSLRPVVPADTRTAAVGPATALALRTAGIAVDLVPAQGGSAAALGTIFPSSHKGDTVLLPQSAISTGEMSRALTDKGFTCRVVTAYRTVPASLPPSVIADLGVGSFDAVLMTSPSTASCLSSISIAAGTVLGAIGTTTAAAAQKLGLEISFVATDPTDPALVDGLVQIARSNRKQSTDV